jgi:hypothetical protein
VDVRVPRISLLSQEVPVWPPASPFMLLALPYYSRTLFGAFSLHSVFGDPSLACAGAYEGMHRAAHAGGGLGTLGAMLGLSCVDKGWGSGFLGNLNPVPPPRVCPLLEFCGPKLAILAALLWQS